jgi:hypothetical protein
LLAVGWCGGGVATGVLFVVGGSAGPVAVAPARYAVKQGRCNGAHAGHGLRRVLVKRRHVPLARARARALHEHTVPPKHTCCSSRQVCFSWCGAARPANSAPKVCCRQETRGASTRASAGRARASTAGVSHNSTKAAPARLCSPCRT